MTSSSKYASAADKYLSPAAAKDHVVAFSISYQRDNMLARGMGLEHLNELLLRLGRYILRQKGRLAYGGNWKDTEDNFMFPLLRLVSAEQQDQSLDAAVADGDPAQSDFDRDVRLYNHLPWPYYMDVTRNTEAQWINCCRIIRITQQRAGIPDAEVVPDANADQANPRTSFNKAVTLSAMRRLMMQPMFVRHSRRAMAEENSPGYRQDTAWRQGGRLCRLSSRHFRGSVDDLAVESARSTSSAALAALRRFWPSHAGNG